MYDLHGKTVLITGASLGIGQALCTAFAKQQVNVVMVARSIETLDKMALTFNQQYQINAIAIQQDLTQKNAAQNIVQKLSQDNITIDILVNNAGYGKFGNFLDFDLNEYHKMLQLNINSLVDLTHLLLPHMIKKNHGGVINVASTAAFIPISGAAIYSASKSFVLYFTESLYGELVNTGVHVSCLCPGATKTNFFNVAAKNKQAFKNSTLDTPKEVAEECIKGFLNHNIIIIPGKVSNKIIPWIIRLFSRKKMIFVVKKAWQKMTIA